MSLTQVNGDGFRFYRYEEEGKEPVELLSVTSIRTLCGESFNLVNWKMANLLDAVLGTMKRTVVGPRGGVKDVRAIAEYPSEFARMYEEADGQQDRIDALRRWTREQADEPRNIAAVRGTLTHAAIERDVAWDRIERSWVENEFANLSNRDRSKIRAGVQDEDVHFVRNSARHYWDMRASLPMTIIAREVRVVNLEVGYAGTFDALVWLHGTLEQDGKFVPMERAAEAASIRPANVDADTIKAYGGTVMLLDWKTSKDIHTDQVVQCHAYLSAEFAVVDDVRDERITALLVGAMHGGLVHIRPNGWALYVFPYEAEAVHAFLGSVTFARYLAKHAKPTHIWTHTFKGESEETEVPI